MSDRERKRENGHPWYSLITDRTAENLNTGEKAFRTVWNALALLSSSAALCGVCLYFAIGRYERFYIFLGYFKNPEIFLLNWLPLLLLQTALYAAFNRQWTAFTVGGLAAVLMSVGNYFKLIYRSDPFTFDDMTSIRAGLAVMDEYHIRVDGRILLAFFFLLFGAGILFFFARGRMSMLSRVLLLCAVAASAVFLWRFVYTDGDRYYENSYSNYPQITRDRRDNFVANGFFYPFLFSITQNFNMPPDGYSEEAAAERYSAYRNASIPEDCRPDIMVIQLESFCDLEAMGITGIAAEVYEPLRQLQQEAYSGLLIPSVIGGGTVTTERCVLTGSYQQQDFYRPAYSYVRYLNAQGYTSTASHPNVPSFYARNGINSFLGFREFYSLENHFGPLTNGEWRCDRVYLPEIFRLFREQAESNDSPAFSFNVSLQGHAPYNTDGFDREDDLWQGDSASESTRYLINNYLSLIAETQKILLEELEKVREDESPMVVLIYGDHKPWFGDSVYEELGISITMESRKGMEDYFSTPYLLWANEAAKKLLKNDFSGDAPTVSPGYLMNVLFEQLAWEGPAFMQYTGDVMKQIPVICTRGGYVEDGQYRQFLSEEGNARLKEYQQILYYIHYRPELAEELPA